MSQPTPEAPPARRFAPLRWLAVPFRRPARWFAHQPRAVRYGLLAVAVAAVVAGGIYARVTLKKRAAAREVGAAWRDFTTAANAFDLDAMRAALARVAAAAPGDPAPAKFAAMIDRGEADPDAPEMAVVFLVVHARADRLPEAAREAAKVLARHPKHWLARCTLAHHALRVEGDAAKAERLLEQLSDPEDPEAGVHAGEIEYALRLSEVIGRDAAALRAVILRRIVPLTRSAAAAGAPPRAKAQLLGCYLEPFADPTALSELAAFWAAADKLAEDAVAEAVAAGDANALVRLAELGPRMAAALAALRVNDPERLPPDRFDPLARAIDDRTCRAWQAVREKSPDRFEAYRGLALAALRASDPAGAVRQLFDGLAACGDRTELVELLVAVMTQYGTDEGIRALADGVWRAAQATKSDPVKWCLAAELALALGRADEALAACAAARAASPNHPWACALEARLWARAGDYFRAGEALVPLGDAVLANPGLTRLHARVMVGAGQWVLRDDEYRKVLDAQAKFKRKSAAPAVGFLLGVLDAPADADRAAWVAGRAELLLADTPDAPLAGKVRAESLYRLAQFSAAAHPKGEGRPPVWNAERSAAALKAIAGMTLDERAEPSAVAAVASLQLRGLGDPDAALRTVTPLLAQEATLAPAHLEVVGTVLVANGRAKDAVRVLERAARSPRATAGCLAALAVAYLKNSQPLDARAAVAAAENVAGRSDREQLELVAAKILIQRENP